MRLPDVLSRVLDALGSFTVGVTLMAIIAAASAVGWLTPQGQNVELLVDAPQWLHGLDSYFPLNDIFHSGWFVLLLALLALNLVTGAIRRVPAAWRQRGRTAGIGSLFLHAGALLILTGAIYNGSAGFCYFTRIVEGEVTVLPQVPFVVRLDRFELEYVPADSSSAAASRPSPDPQEAVLTLLQSEQLVGQRTTRMGRSIHVEGFNLLPSATDTGWAFTLVIRDPVGREKVVPVNPWAPPLTRLGPTRQYVFADSVAWSGLRQGGDEAGKRPDAAEIFLVEENVERQSLGLATETAPVSASGYMVSVWRIRPYTGLFVSRLPGLPLMMAGIVCLVAAAATAGFAFAVSGRRKAGGG